MSVLSEAGGEGIGNSEAVGIAERWARRAEVIVDVVFVRVCRAFGAGLERYIISSLLGRGRRRLTWRVAAVGPFFSPFMTTFQMSSNGGSSSHGIEINGESHLTIDDGSSNLIKRLSNLVISSAYTNLMRKLYIRGWLVRTLAPLIVPFSTLFRRCNNVYLTSAPRTMWTVII
jgi:hypothetical protein